jgi:hypothetical protein
VELNSVQRLNLLTGNQELERECHLIFVIPGGTEMSWSGISSLTGREDVGDQNSDEPETITSRVCAARHPTASCQSHAAREDSLNGTNVPNSVVF